MENPLSQTQQSVIPSSKEKAEDIATQSYEGPTPVVAAAGEGYVAHFKYAGVGLLTGIGLSTIFQEKTHAAVEKMRDYARAREESFLGRSVFALFGRGVGNQQVLERLEEQLVEGSSERRAMDKVIRSRELGFGYFLLDHTVGAVGGRTMMHGLLEKGGERAATAVTIGGILGGIGFFFSPFLFAHRGMKRAWRGEEQLQQAQAEIMGLRDQYEDLQDRYLDTRNALDDLSHPDRQKKHAKAEEVTPMALDTVRAGTESDAQKDMADPTTTVEHRKHPPQAQRDGEQKSRHLPHSHGEPAHHVSSVGHHGAVAAHEKHPQHAVPA